MPPVSTSPVSPTRRRSLRASITPTSGTSSSQRNINSNNTSRSSLFKNKKTTSSNNNIVSSTGNSSRCSTTTGSSNQWPFVSPSSTNNSHDLNIIASRYKKSSSSPAPAPAPAPTAPVTPSTTTSPRSVASLVSFYTSSSPCPTSTSSVKKFPTTTKNDNSNARYSSKPVALHVAQTDSSLEITTVLAAEGGGVGGTTNKSHRGQQQLLLLSCNDDHHDHDDGGSTVSGDSFILPLDNDSMFDDNGFFLSQQNPQELESSALLHAFDDSFDDPYLVQKEELRTRKNKTNNKRQDERDYFCTGSKSTSSANNPLQQEPSSTVDTECSTAAASGAASSGGGGGGGVAARYLDQQPRRPGQEADANNIPPPPVPSLLHGVPPRKHFGETDELSVPSQNEEHGGDVDFYQVNDDGQDEEVEVQHVAAKQQKQDKNNVNKNSNNTDLLFAASMASIEVDDQQGILVSNSTSCHATTMQKTRAAQHAHALYFWNTRLTARITTHGPLHFCTAAAWLELGNAHFEAREFHAAFRAFSCAQRILKTRYATTRPVALARALNRMGVACSKTARHVIDANEDSVSLSTATTTTRNLTPDQIFQKAMDLLLEAFRIRHAELGPWHVDTVDCLNHLAWVQYDAGLYDIARRSFWEVFFVRKAIFGSCHPGVAVAAHDLANCFFKLGSSDTVGGPGGPDNLDNADNFYSIALEIYDAMNVPMQNPAVARLLRDMKRLERLQTTF